MKRSLLLIIGSVALAPSLAFAQTPAPTPTPAPAPAPAPKFNSGSPLDGLRNEAWSKLEEMTDAYERCDWERFERALDELEQLRQRAKASADAARAAPEFRTVNPEEADGLADTLADQVRQRRYVLDALKRECGKQHRPGGIGTILGPRKPTGTTGTQPPAQPPQGGAVQQQPPPTSTTTGPATGSSPPPAQGLSEAEQKELAEKLEEAEKIEEAVRDIEGDEWLHQEVRAGVLKRVRDNLLQDKRFAPDSIQRWVERLNRVWESLPPEAKTEAERPPGPVRSTTLPMKLPPMPPPPPSAGPQSSVPIRPATPLTGLELALLNAHNRVRAEVGSPPLVWDPQLAAQAASYGPQLAQYGRPVHSSRVGRETSRENLLQALPGTSVEKMVGVWTAERQNFVDGTFPNVSRTGNWADVGHYTQMVWPTTTNVGCAVQRGIGRFDWLICRYSPGGNKDGRPVLLPRQPVLASRKGRGAVDGEGDYCDNATAVNTEGDCDSSAQCSGGAVCVTDNGGRYAGPAGDDASQQDDHCAPAAASGGDCDTNEECAPGRPQTAGSTCTADSGNRFSQPGECTQPGADPRRCPDETTPAPAGGRSVLEEIEESDRSGVEQRKAGATPPTPPPPPK